MSKILGWLVALAFLASCGEDAPSCQQAVDHYYGAGCRLVNLQTGVEFTAAEVIADCKGALAAAPDRCQDELDDLRSCWGGVRTPAASIADCDCSREQDAILTCE